MTPQPPAAPPGAAALFGDRLSLAETFVATLADTGVSHGLIGPREVPRLWERHVLNCAVIADALPTEATVIDVGSGAGLPGLALAIVRPDLAVHLVEPMARRVAWLQETVETLALPRVTVHRGRAEELAGELSAEWVTARAVARLATLARWCRPLLEPNGTLMAIKGSSAAVELEEDRAELVRLGLIDARIAEHGSGVLDPPTLTVDLRFAATTTGMPSDWSAPRRPPRRSSRGGRVRGGRATGRG